MIHIFVHLLDFLYRKLCKPYPTLCLGCLFKNFRIGLKLFRGKKPVQPPIGEEPHKEEEETCNKRIITNSCKYNKIQNNNGTISCKMFFKEKKFIFQWLNSRHIHIDLASTSHYFRHMSNAKISEYYGLSEAASLRLRFRPQLRHPPDLMDCSHSYSECTQSFRSYDHVYWFSAL